MQAIGALRLQITGRAGERQVQWQGSISAIHRQVTCNACQGKRRRKGGRIHIQSNLTLHQKIW